VNDGPNPKLVEHLKGVWDALFWFFTNSELGSFASIIGLLFTLFVFFSVRDIRRRVLFKLRAPEAMKDLTERATNLSNAMQDFNNSLPLIEEQLALANETLKNVLSKVSGDAKKTIKAAMRSIAQFRALPTNRKKREETRRVYIQILTSAKAIEHLIADAREEP
jgi:hypothetical protein